LVLNVPSHAQQTLQPLPPCQAAEHHAVVSAEHRLLLFTPSPYRTLQYSVKILSSLKVVAAGIPPPQVQLIKRKVDLIRRSQMNSSCAVGAAER
jgi:hypothetical protein